MSRCAHLVRMIFRIVVARVSTGLCAHVHFDIVLAFLRCLCYNKAAHDIVPFISFALFGLLCRAGRFL